MREVRQAEAARIAALRRVLGRRRPARRHGAPLGSVTAAVDAAPPYMWAVGGSVLASPGGRRLVSLGVERRDWPGSAATTRTRRVPGGWGWRAALSKSETHQPRFPAARPPHVPRSGPGRLSTPKRSSNARQRPPPRTRATLCLALGARCPERPVGGARQLARPASEALVVPNQLAGYLDLHNWRRRVWKDAFPGSSPYGGRHSYASCTRVAASPL